MRVQEAGKERNEENNHESWRIAENVGQVIQPGLR